MKFVLCIDNSGNEVSLKNFKVYKVIPDKKAMNSGLLRIIDETKEDYLFPSDCFVEIEIPQKIQNIYKKLEKVK